MDSFIDVIIILSISLILFVILSMRKEIKKLKIVSSESNERCNQNFSKIKDSFNLLIEASNRNTKNVEVLHERLDDMDEMAAMGNLEDFQGLEETIQGAKNKGNKKLH